MKWENRGRLRYRRGPEGVPRRVRVVVSRRRVFRRRLWSEAGACSRGRVTKEGVGGEARTHETRRTGGGQHGVSGG